MTVDGVGDRIIIMKGKETKTKGSLHGPGMSVLRVSHLDDFKLVYFKHWLT